MHPPTLARHVERRFGLTRVSPEGLAVPVLEPYFAGVLPPSALLRQKREPPAVPRQLPGDKLSFAKWNLEDS